MRIKKKINKEDLIRTNMEDLKVELTRKFAKKELTKKI